jgi:hypothetical protein
MTAPYLEKFESMLDTAYLKLMQARGKDVSAHKADSALLRELRQTNPDVDVANAIFKAVDDQVWNSAHLPWRLKLVLERDEADIWHVKTDGFDISMVSPGDDLKPLFDLVENNIGKMDKERDKVFRKWHAETEIDGDVFGPDFRSPEGDQGARSGFG